MTTDNIYTANAPEVAQVTTVTIVDADPNSPYAVQIGGKAITVDGSSSPSDIATRLAAAWQASEIPETDAATAEAAGAVVTLTAVDPGVPFRVTATRDPSIDVETSQAGSAAVNQRTTITLPSTTDGGTFTITLTLPDATEVTTSALAYDATDATVETALDALTGVSSGDALVDKPLDLKWSIEFAGNFAGQAVGVSVNTDSLAGNATVTIAKVQEAGKDVHEIQFFGTNALVISTEDPATFTYDGQTASTSGVISEAAIQSALDDLFGEDATVATLEQTTAGGASLLTVRWVDGLPKERLIVRGSGFWPVTGELIDGGEATKDQVNLCVATANFTLTVNGETTASLDPSSNPNIKAALSALPSLSASDFDIVTAMTDATGIVFLIRFRGTLAGDAVTMTASTGTVTEVRAGGPLQNDIHSIYVNAAGGTWDIHVPDDEETLDYTDTAADVQAALEGLGADTPDLNGNITVSGQAPTYLIEYHTALAGTSVELPTLLTNNLTGGAAASLSELQAAVAGVNEIQVITFDEFAIGGTGALQYAGELTAAIAYNATAATVQTALTDLDSIGASDVTVAGEAGGPYTVEFASSLAQKDVPTIVGIPDGLTISLAAISVVTSQRSRGPLHADDPLNWSLGHVLRTDERPVFDRGRIGPTFGIRWRDTFTVIIDDPLTAATETATTRLRLASGYTHLRVGQTVKLKTSDTLPAGLATATLYYVVSADADLGYVALSTTENGSAVSITDAGTGTHTIAVEADGLLQYAKHTGEIGLAARHADGYAEYLPTHFSIGIATGGVIVIGEGDGTGSGLIRIDTGDDAVAVQALLTAGPSESDANALEWITKADGSTLLNLEASTGVVPRIGQVGALGNLTQRGGEIDLGPGLTFSAAAAIDKTGGVLRADEVTIDGVIKLRG